jgi:hypothetical protein
VPALINDAPLTRNSAFAVVGLTALFVAVGADPADRLPLGLGVLYWLTHIGFGLAAAVIATRALCAWQVSRRWSPWIVVLVGGTLGAMAFTPFALGIEALMPAAQAVDLDVDWLDRLEARGGGFAAIGEFLQVYPSYIAAWLLLQSTPLIDSHRSRLRSPAADDEPAVDEPAVEVPPAPVPTEAQGEPGLLTQLPRHLGDTIAIRADLHYLHVTATQGEATLLGTMAAVDRELKDQGVRVHRSFWVATAHVRRMVRGPYGWSCELSDGSKVPVSRRRVSEVKQRLQQA